VDRSRGKKKNHLTHLLFWSLRKGGERKNRGRKGKEIASKGYGPQLGPQNTKKKKKKKKHKTEKKKKMKASLRWKRARLIVY